MEHESYKLAKGAFIDLAQSCDITVICWRKLSVSSECLGAEAKKTEPCMRQVFVTASYVESDPARFERNVYLLRKQCVHHAAKQNIRCYVVSLSTKTIIYKGQFTPFQLYAYYKDLSNPNFVTHIALVHSRFSTNTFPSWNRAQPNR